MPGTGCFQRFGGAGRRSHQTQFRQRRGGQLTHGERYAKHQRGNGGRQQRRGNVRAGIRPFGAHGESRLNLPDDIRAVQDAQYANRQHHTADDLHACRRDARARLIHAAGERGGKRQQRQSADDQQRHNHVGRTMPLRRDHRQSDQHRIRPTNHRHQRTQHARYGAQQHHTCRSGKDDMSGRRGIIRIRFQINKIRAWQQRLQQFGRGETQASEYSELRDRQPPFAHDQHGKRDCPHDDADGDDHCGNGEDVHDRRQPTRQRGIEFRPDDILIALAVHGTHAKPPDAGGSGKHQQTEHHAQHDAGHARMAGQRIRLSQAFVDILRRKHRLDFAHIRERQRFQRFRRRCCRGLLKHVHRLLWISDKWLEFVGHSHREYGIAPTVGNESEKI